MNTIRVLIIFFSVLLISYPSLAQNEYNFSPKSIFNKKQTELALSKGSSTIKGQIFYKDSSKNTGYKEEIHLYPATDFLNEWYGFRQQKIGFQSKEIFANEPEAEEQKLIAQADENGYFEFKDLKPGKYYLESIFRYTKDLTKDLYLSNSTNISGTTNYYERKNITKDFRIRLNEFVEIKKDGEIMKIKLNRKRY